MVTPREFAYQYVEGVILDALDRDVQEDLEWFAKGYLLVDNSYISEATDHATYLLNQLLYKLNRRGM